MLVVIVFSLLFLLSEDVANAVVDVRAQGQSQICQASADWVEEILRPQQEIGPESKLDQDSNEATGQTENRQNREDGENAYHGKCQIDRDGTDEVHEPGEILGRVHRPTIELGIGVDVLRFRVRDSVFVDDLNHRVIVDHNDANIRARLTVRESFMTGEEGDEGRHSLFL